jgi:dTDP-4-amino-4,6-dideoxygalactose transaminase
MDSIHAAIGLVQLAKLEEMNLRRREIAGMYRRGLDKRIRFTEDSQENFHNYHLFLIRIDKEIIPRDEFVGKLKERNIGCSVHFIPLHRHPFYKKKFPVADKAYGEAVSIPLFPGMSDQDVEYVIDNVNQVLKGGG